MDFWVLTILCERMLFWLHSSQQPHLYFVLARHDRLYIDVRVKG